MQLTFAPSINPCYSINSRPLLDLANPSAYLAHEEAQRRRLEAARRAAAEERKVRGSHSLMIIMSHFPTGTHSMHGSTRA